MVHKRKYKRRLKEEDERLEEETPVYSTPEPEPLSVTFQRLGTVQAGSSVSKWLQNRITNVKEFEGKRRYMKEHGLKEV